MNCINAIKLTALLLTTTMVAGCGPADPVLSSTEKWYEITEIKRPKRFKVSLRDESGREYPMLSVSTRCSAWEKLQIGSRWLFVEVNRQGKDRVYTEIHGVSELCNKLQTM